MLDTLSQVVQFVHEHYFCEEMLPPGQGPSDVAVQELTTALGIYLQHYCVTTEGGLRNLKPEVLHANEVEDTSPVSSFNSEVNIKVLLDLVDNLCTMYKKSRQHVMLISAWGKQT